MNLISNKSKLIIIIQMMLLFVNHNSLASNHFSNSSVSDNVIVFMWSPTLYKNEKFNIYSEHSKLLDSRKVDDDISQSELNICIIGYENNNYIAKITYNNSKVTSSISGDIELLNKYAKSLDELEIIITLDKTGKILTVKNMDDVAPRVDSLNDFVAKQMEKAGTPQYKIKQRIAESRKYQLNERNFIETILNEVVIINSIYFRKLLLNSKKVMHSNVQALDNKGVFATEGYDLLTKDTNTNEYSLERRMAISPESQQELRSYIDTHDNSSSFENSKIEYSERTLFVINGATQIVKSVDYQRDKVVGNAESIYKFKIEHVMH